MASSPFSFCLVLTLVFVWRVEGQNCDSTSALSDSSHSVVTGNAEEARVAAFCHVACINYFFRSMSGNGTNDTNMDNNTPIDGQNDTVVEEESTMPGVYVFTRCRDLRKYLDCRSGCIAQSNNNCGNCRGRCQDLCRFSSCEFAGLVIGNQCGAQCDTNDCNNGCQRTIPSDVLEKPSAPPVLTPMSDTSLFDVDVPMELEMFEKPSVVFQIEYRPGVFVYHWMVDVIMTSFTEITIADFLLDLTSFPAESRLNVSFAYATEESGISTFSDPTEVQLSGTCSVSALTETQVSITSDRDRRAGFFNHPVLHITWCPTSCPEGVLRYTVTRTNCDEEVSETVNSTTSSVTLRSKSPGFFIRPCTVRVEVKTFLENVGDTQLVARTVMLSNAHENDFPELEISCSAVYDREEEKYILESQLTAPFSPATLSNIELFVIRWDSYLKPTGIASQPTAVALGLFRITIPVSVNQTVYHFSQQLEPFKNQSRFYRTSVEVFWREVGRGLPAFSINCEEDGVNAPPPLPISLINITNRDTGRVTPTDDGRDVEVTLRFKFERPEVLFSEATPLVYEVYLGLNRLGPTRDDQVSKTGLRGDILRTFPASLNEDMIKTYLRIRSYQFRDFPSDWSDPMEVQFLVLPIPGPANDLAVQLSQVNVEHRELGAYILLSGDVTWTWSEANSDLPGAAVFDHFNVIIGPATYTHMNRTFPLDQADILLPDDFMLDLPFSVSVRVSWEEETQTSDPRTQTKKIRPVSPPRNITILPLNPRLVADGSQTMLSADVVVQWASPGLEDLAKYEIKVTTDPNGLEEFGEFSKSHDSVAPGSTQLIKNFTEVEDDPQNPQIVVQMRSMMADLVNGDTIFLPRWSDPEPVSIDILPPPAISSQLLSYSLVPAEEKFSVSTSVNLTWERTGEGDEIERYEVWVGSRALAEFEQPDNEDFGQIFIFPVDDPSASDTSTNSTSENSTTTDNPNATNETNMSTLITEVVSAQFLDESPSGTVHIQIRSVSMTKIPKWSTPSLTHQRQASLPPVNIMVGTPDIIRDDVKNLIDVKVELVWELPMIVEDEGTEAPAATSFVLAFPSSSFVISLIPSPSLFPSPSPSPNERNKRQIEGGESETGSGSGLGSGDDTVPPQLPNITAIWAYMGKAELDTYAPRPEENVQDFKPDETSGPVSMTFSTQEKENLTLYVQMQIEREGSFPTWSDPKRITIPPVTPATKGVRVTEGTVPTLPIALSVVGAVVLVLIIAIVIVICCICYNKRQYKIIADGQEDALDIYSRPGLTGLYSGKGPILDEWEISTDDVIVDELLGEGAFGEVYKGVIRGPLENPKISAVLRQAIGVPVAIKLLKTTSAGKEKADFLAEIDMMKKIAEGYNTHIVNMVGCVTLQEPLCLITEFIPYGDLLSYLKHQRKKRSEARRREKLRQQQGLEHGQTNGGGESYEIMITPGTQQGGGGGGEGGGGGYEVMTPGGDTTTTGGGGEDAYDAPILPSPAPYLETPNAYSHLEPKTTEDPQTPEEDHSQYKDLGDIEPDDLIRFAYQIASGMEYLASLSIVHRDLACRNVLISKDKLLKITDFGLSREVQEVYVKKTRGRLPLKWMAIESITAREFTTASDVWGFGVALYEIGTIGGFPYPSINNEDLLRMLSQGYRLEKPDNCSAEVYDLMLHCWQEDPPDRPSFSQLRSQFSAMLQAGSAEEYIDLQINEEAPYYQMRDEDRRERSDSASSESSEGSIDSLTKEKIPKEKKKVKRKRTNPYVSTPQQQQQNQQEGGEDGYIPMESAGSALDDRPVQLGIPISQLMPANDNQPTPVNEVETPLENRRTNPYVTEPSEVADGSLVASSVPLVVTTDGVMTVRDSVMELTESTHL